MRTSIHSDAGRLSAPRERKLFRSLLLGSATVCVTLSLLHIEPSVSSITTLVMQGGTRIVDPLLTTIRRRINW